MWENITNIENEYVDIQYSNIQQGALGVGNISTNPLFLFQLTQLTQTITYYASHLALMLVTPKAITTTQMEQ